MRPAKPLIIIVAGLLLTACGGAPASAPTGGAVEAATVPTSSSAPTSVTTMGDLLLDIDEKAYVPPKRWPVPCQNAYLNLVVGMIFNANAVNHLLKRKEDPAFTIKAVTIVYDVNILKIPQEDLRKCRQVAPALGARFYRGLDAAHTVMRIVSRGPDLSPEERTALRDLLKPLKDATRQGPAGSSRDRPGS
ncbi:hypothetical protein [Streptosporangium sp. NPDC087985]|uniref:hypothetical protein n=1 Tax=Streptosporangium sp. NPDC087985 TaxID=3366196 RepID=UPI0037F4AEB7